VAARSFITLSLTKLARERGEAEDEAKKLHFLRAGLGAPLSAAESGVMFVFLLPKRGRTFAGELPNTPGMFAWGFAIF